METITYLCSTYIIHIFKNRHTLHYKTDVFADGKLLGNCLGRSTNKFAAIKLFWKIQQNSLDKNRAYSLQLYLKDDINISVFTAQKLNFSIKDFFIKYDQIHSFLRICSHLLKRSLMENFIFCALYHVIFAIFYRVALLQKSPDYCFWLF